MMDDRPNRAKEKDAKAKAKTAKAQSLVEKNHGPDGTPKEAPKAPSAPQG